MGRYKGDTRGHVYWEYPMLSSVRMQNGSAVCECVSLAFQWLVFYLQPRSAVQEYGGGEHHLYGGDAYGVWMDLPRMGVLYWEPEVMETFSRLVGCKPECVP